VNPDSSGRVTDPPRSPPDSSEPLPPWLRYLTHLVALGWATAEMGWWGGRPGPLAFITIVLTASEGTRAVSKLRRALTQ